MFLWSYQCFLFPRPPRTFDRSAISPSSPGDLGQVEGSTQQVEWHPLHRRSFSKIGPGRATGARDVLIKKTRQGGKIVQRGGSIRPATSFVCYFGRQSRKQQPSLRVSIIRPIHKAQPQKGQSHQMEKPKPVVFVLSDLRWWNPCSQQIQKPSLKIFHYRQVGSKFFQRTPKTYED